MSLHPHAIEIDGGILKSTTRHTAAGSYPEYIGIGDYHFYVDLIEEDGARIGLWSGFDYSTAIIEAEVARVEFGVAERVRSRIGGGA
ncbi:MAG: hypothetical protein ABIQ30_10180 [Devosia sp.]